MGEEETGTEETGPTTRVKGGSCLSGGVGWQTEGEPLRTVQLWVFPPTDLPGPRSVPRAGQLQRFTTVWSAAGHSGQGGGGVVGTAHGANVGLELGVVQLERRGKSYRSRAAAVQLGPFGLREPRAPSWVAGLGWTPLDRRSSLTRG